MESAGDRWLSTTSPHIGEGVAFCDLKRWDTAVDVVDKEVERGSILHVSRAQAKELIHISAVKLLSGPSLAFLIVIIWAKVGLLSDNLGQGHFRLMFVVVSGDFLLS